MSELKNQKCEACHAGAPLATPEEISEYMKEISDWKIAKEENMQRLIRTYTFEDFVKALDFTNQVGQIAEEAGHHPAILTEWGRVTVSWWTHKISGLHANDFIMAARTDGLLQSGI